MILREGELVAIGGKWGLDWGSVELGVKCLARKEDRAALGDRQAAERGREQRRLKRGVVQPRWQRPQEARRACPPCVVAHRAVGDAERRGDLSVAAPERVLQVQKLSNLPHGPLL